MPKIDLVLTQEPTEAGEAAVIRNGKPLYTVDGEELELDYQHLRGELTKANAEAQQRREVLQQVATQLGLDVDIRNDEGLKALVAATESYAADQSDLDSLRRAREAGELDETADEKIKKMAATLRQKELDAAQQQIQELKTDVGKFRTKAEATAAALAKNQTTTALRHWYDKIEGLREDSLKTFLAVSQQEHGGYKWRPTGEVDEAGIATLALMDDAGNIKTGPDGVSPINPRGWATSELRSSHPVLFAPKNGGPDDVEPGGNLPGSKNPADMSQAELDEAARRQHGAR